MQCTSSRTIDPYASQYALAPSTAPSNGRKQPKISQEEYSARQFLELRQNTELVQTYYCGKGVGT